MIEVSTNQEKLAELDAQIAKFQEQRKQLAASVGGEIVNEVFAPLFAFDPVVSASWRQYTPYFNDGDPCEFNVYSDLALVLDGIDADDDDEYDEGEISTYSIPDSLPDEFVREPVPQRYLVDWRGMPQDRSHEWNAYQDRQAAQIEAWRNDGWTDDSLKEFKRVIKGIERWLSDHEDFLEDAYGDHVKVIVSRTGIEVEEYDHD